MQNVMCFLLVCLSVGFALVCFCFACMFRSFVSCLFVCRSLDVLCVHSKHAISSFFEHCFSDKKSQQVTIQNAMCFLLVCFSVSFALVCGLGLLACLGACFKLLVSHLLSSGLILAWLALACLDLSWTGLAWLGMARLGLACFGLCLLSLAWLGLDALGLA